MLNFHCIKSAGQIEKFLYTSIILIISTIMLAATTNRIVIKLILKFYIL